MPRTQKQNEEIKEAMILKIQETGLKLFSQKGLTATSITDIANDAEISIGLMYHYYKSKEDLYSELIKTAIEESTEALKQLALMKASPIEKIQLFTKQILDDTENGDRTSRFYLLVTQALLGVNLPEKAKKHLDNSYEGLEIMASIVKEGQKTNEIKEGNTKTLTTLFLASINGICTYKLILGKEFITPEPEMITALLTKK